MKDYSLFFQFAIENAPTGFSEVKQDGPLYLSIKHQCETLRQTFYVADILNVKFTFCEDGVGPVLGLPEGTPASMFGAPSVHNAIHTDDQMRYKNGFSKLISLGYGMTLSKDRDKVYAMDFRVMDNNGKVNHQLFQVYIFKTDDPAPNVYGVVVITNINHLVPGDMGFYMYLGDDLAQFRYPDEEMLRPRIHLSTREMEILGFISGYTKSSDIGEKLYISRHTVDTHRRNILKKTGYKSTNELIAYLEKMGIL